MNKYYAVVTTIPDDTKLAHAAVIDTIEADKKPEDSRKYLRDKDIYVDWFDDINKAKASVAEIMES